MVEQTSFRSPRSWLLGDHLGSTSMVTDASGVMVSETRYSAFGETRYQNGTLTTDYLYTGQREEEEIGLYYYVARWYDPAIGRFIQADSVVPNPASAVGFDRYAYVNNNPVKYTDSSGHLPDNPTPYPLPLPKNNEAGWDTVLEIIGVVLMVGVVDAPRRHGSNNGACNDSLAECFTQQETMNFSPNQVIDENEFEEFLEVVYQDVDDSILRTSIDPARSDYDTPFFTGNRNFGEETRSDQMVEIDGVLYHQSAVNYVAQGMYVAKTPLKLRWLGELSGWAWNEIVNRSKFTEEEKYWFNYGYDYYIERKNQEKLIENLE